MGINKQDKRVEKEWPKAIEALEKEFLQGNQNNIANDEKQARCIFFFMDLGKKEMDPFWGKKWFTSALLDQSDILHQMVNEYDPTSSFRKDVDKLISQCKILVVFESTKRMEMKQLIQRVMNASPVDTLSVNTRILLDLYESAYEKSELKKVMVVNEGVFPPKPDLIWNESSTVQKEPVNTQVQPNELKRPTPQASRISDQSDSEVLIYTQEELDEIIKELKRSLKENEDRHRKKQLRQLFFILVTFFIAIVFVGYFVYQHNSRLSIPEIEQYTVNPSEIEGAYTLTHIENGTRDEMPMQAAIKHIQDEKYVVALLSEYDPEYYEIDIHKNGSVHSPELGDGKLVPNHAGMIIIELTKDNVTWKLMK